MNELERWTDITQKRIASGALKPGDIPGYLQPDPLAKITVQNSRMGAGDGTSVIWSFQATMQRRVQQLVGSSAFRATATPELVRELLGQSADDGVSNLGDADPDCADRDALLEMYINLFWYGVTPV